MSEAFRIEPDLVAAAVRAGEKKFVALYLAAGYDINRQTKDFERSVLA